MAREYYLVCSTCKEFLDLHKFKLVPEICAQSPLGLDGTAVRLVQIREGIKQVEELNQNNGWIHSLLPQIETFASTHAAHDLRMVDDCEPDYYWWPEHPGYTEWKEIPAAMTNEFFLPRNLVDDLQITHWEEAERYLKTSGIILYEELELIEYRRKFDQLTGITNLL